MKKCFNRSLPKKTQQNEIDKTDWYNYFVNMFSMIAII